MFEYAIDTVHCIVIIVHMYVCERERGGGERERGIREEVCVLMRELYIPFCSDRFFFTFYFGYNMLKLKAKNKKTGNFPFGILFNTPRSKQEKQESKQIQARKHSCYL